MQKRGDDGAWVVTDAADGGIAWVAAAAGEISRATGLSVYCRQILQRAHRPSLRHALAPTFRAGAMLLIIPSRVGAAPNLTRRCSTGASR